jgi:hypothetical protein
VWSDTFEIIERRFSSAPANAEHERGDEPAEPDERRDHGDNEGRQTVRSYATGN